MVKNFADGDAIAGEKYTVPSQVPLIDKSTHLFDLLFMLPL
jgi:hypothetical protein